MAEPGWYDDPSGAPGHRWWDGTAWTTATRVAPSAPEPTSRGRRPLIAAAVALVVLIGGGTALAVLLGDDDPELAINPTDDAPDDDLGGNEEPAPTEPEPDEVTDDPPDLPEPEFTDEGAITMLHPLTGDSDVAGLRFLLDSFNREFPGIQIQEQGSLDFEALVRTRARGGNPPDIILAPQPGLVNELADDGLVTPLDDVIDVPATADAIPTGLLGTTQRDGRHFGMPFRLAPKSIIWYRPNEFAELGYEEPGTFDELLALTDQMVADGRTPWCIGIESGDATGWVATDWMEDAVLGSLGLEAYERWVNGDLAFDSPEIRQAVDSTMVSIWTDDAAVDGGRLAIAQISFADAIVNLFDDRCLMHRQASFAEAFFPTEAIYGETVSHFPVPSMAGTTPMVVSGDIAALLTDNPAAKTFMRWLATEDAARTIAAEFGIPARVDDVPQGAYSRPLHADMATSVSAADVVAFDGSDQMPRSVGAGVFWTEMTAWTNDDRSLGEAFRAIDDAFP